MTSPHLYGPWGHHHALLAHPSSAGNSRKKHRKAPYTPCRPLPSPPTRQWNMRFQDCKTPRGPGPAAVRRSGGSNVRCFNPSVVGIQEASPSPGELPHFRPAERVNYPPPMVVPAKEKFFFANPRTSLGVRWLTDPNHPCME